jgi:oxaloacetate decarboxylase alpha subunit
MDPDIKDRILGTPRARELEKWQPPEPSLAEMRKKYGGRGVSDEDMILRWIMSKEEVDLMHAAGPPREYFDAEQPLVTLIRELTRRTDCSGIRVRKPGFSLILERRGAAA